MSLRTAYVGENRKGLLGQTVRVRDEVLRADEPVEAGGLGEGLDPYEFLIAGLGACTTMTVRLYAQRKGWPLDHVEVIVRHEAARSQGAEQDVFTREIRLDGDLSPEERQRLFQIAEHCPVSRTLAGGSLIRSTLSDVGEGVGEASS